MERPKVGLQRPERQQLAGGAGKLQRRKPTDPDFASMFEEGDNGNPLDSLPEFESGQLQEFSEREMSAVEKEIEANRKASEERFRITNDVDYYFCLCFQTREQKEDFLKRAGWDDLGDLYLNGLEIAKRLNVPIEVIPIEPRKLRGNPKKFQREEVIGNA